MKRTDLNSEERTFLELIAMNVWQARRQGATELLSNLVFNKLIQAAA